MTGTRFWPDYTRRLQGESISEPYAFRIVSRSSEIRWVEIKPVRIPWMDKMAILSFMSDITRRKMDEDRLHLLESAVVYANDGVVVLEPDPDRQGRPKIVYVNPAFKRMTGYGDDIIGKSPEILSGTSTDPVQIARIRNAITRKETLRSDRINYRKDGTEFWSEMNLVPILDEMGDVTHWISLERDTTDRHRSEEKLREWENYLKTIFNSVQAGLLIIDPETHLICDVNPKGAELIGIDRSKIIGSVCHQFVCPAEAEKCPITDLGQKIDNSERILLKTGGSRIPIIKTVTPITIKGHNYLLESFLDISERKIAERALQESEAKFRDLAERSLVGIYLIQDGIYKYVNPRFADIHGYSVEEILDVLGPKTLVHPDDWPLAEENIRKRLSGESQFVHYEIRHVTKKGEIRSVELTGSRTLYQGRPAIVGTILDITERKRAEESLKAARDQLFAIIEFLPDATFVIDRDKMVIAWNRAIEEMTDVCKEDLIGKGNYAYSLPFYGEPRPILIDLIDLIDKHDEEIESKYTHIVRKERSIYAEAHVPSLFNGQGAYVGATASLLYDSEDNKTGAIESIRDITERKNAEQIRERLVTELESKNAEMERFTYTVSHDLRSPLITVNGLVGFLKSDLEKGNTTRIDTYFERISKAIAKMDNLLKDTLELSRIGRVANPPENVPFGNIIQEALSQVQGRITNNGVKVTVAQDMPDVYVDKMRIVEVMVNLIENSIKYMGDQAQPKIEIGHQSKDGLCTFFIKDNGIGIDPSQYDKVFELFYKVDNKSEGTGAGLAIVKRIIEVQGGRIWVESEKGKGSTFYFTLPNQPSKGV